MNTDKKKEFLLSITQAFLLFICVYPRSSAVKISG